MTVFFPKEHFGKLKSGPGYADILKGPYHPSNWVEARALPAIEIALRYASPFFNIHTAHAHEMECQALFASILTTPTFASLCTAVEAVVAVVARSGP